MAAHVLPVCECGVKPARFSQTVMEILLHGARNGTSPQQENPRGITLVLLLLCLVLLLAVWNRNEKKCCIPGPWFCLGLGPLLSYLRFIWMGIGTASNYYNEKYGDMVRVWICGEETLVLSRPSAVYHVLKHSQYTSRFGSKVGLQCLGMHEQGIIFNSNVALWKKVRSYFAKALTGPGLQRTLKICTTSANTHTWMICLSCGRAGTGERPEPAALHCGGHLQPPVPGCATKRTKPAVQNPQVLRHVADGLDQTGHLFQAEVAPRQTQARCSGTSRRLCDLLNRNELNCSRLKNSTTCFTEELIFAQSHGELTAENVGQCVLEMVIAAPDTLSISVFFMLLLLKQDTEVERRILTEIHTVLGEAELQHSHLPQLTFWSVSLWLCAFTVVDSACAALTMMSLRATGTERDKHHPDVGRMHRSEFFPNPQSSASNNFNKLVPSRFFQPFGSGPRFLCWYTSPWCDEGHLGVGVVSFLRVSWESCTVENIAHTNDLSQQPVEDTLSVRFIPRNTHTRTQA
uniref:Cytochrome P450 aromatase n=1 Tax=Clarias gariepinus TaxID=13013 RepID=D7PC78_CLAGA|nr:cytochrome P450 aromatase [Clarias gariepinus]